MIAKPYIAKWQEQAPWKQFYQIEQDLVICRTLIEIFSDDFKQQTTNNKQQTINNKQPSTINHQPSTNNQQPLSEPLKRKNGSKTH